MALQQILNWFRKAVPSPEKKNFNTQTGVHMEEVAEMMDALVGDNNESEMAMIVMRHTMHGFAAKVKSGEISLSVKDPVELLDALCDQVVTATGVAHMANLDIIPAAKQVADSNDSKFDADGNPILT